MNAIILTEEQATALLAANGDSPLTLQPRRLEDGRLILNADILDDPFFAAPSRPWAQALGLAVENVPDDETAVDVINPGTVDSGVKTTDPTPTVDSSSLQIVTLTDADLAETI